MNEDIQQENAPKSKSLWWILIVGLIIIIGLAGYFFWPKDSEPKDNTTDTSKTSTAELDETWVISPQIQQANTTSTDTHKLADGTYRMYYMGQGDILYADSTDAKTFSKAVATGIKQDAGKMISNPAVIEVSTGNWIMIYEQAPMKTPGQQNTPSGPSNQRNLYLSTSVDGKSFKAAGLAIDSSKEDNYFASVPDLVKTADGKIRMYYVSRGDSIGSALSSDGGKTWVRESGFRLTNMAVDPDASCKITTSSTSCVMYYTILDPQRNGIYKATSTDGLKWTELGKVFSATTSGAVVDADVVEGPSGNYVMFLGQTENGDSTGGETLNLYRAELNKSIY